MAGEITSLAAQTGALAVGTDLLETVDVSDTSMAATGTNKKFSLTEMIAFLKANGVVATGGALGTPTSGTLTNCSGLPESGVTNLVTDLANKQPLDADLTTIAGLTATDQYVIQSYLGGWAARSVAQLMSTLPYVSTSAAGVVPQAPNSTFHFFHGDGTWANLPAAVPPSGTITIGMFQNGDFGDWSVASGAATIDNFAVTNPKLALMNGYTLKGNNAGSSGQAADLTPTQATAVLSQDLTGDVNKMRKAILADGTWGYYRRTSLTVVASTYALTDVNDESKFILMNSASAQTVLTYNDAGANFPVGAEVDFIQIGAGQVSFAVATGTLSGTPGTRMRAQYSAATLKKISSNNWVLIGDLAS